MVFPWHNYVCKSPLHFHKIRFNLNKINENSTHKVPIINNDCFFFWWLVDQMTSDNTKKSFIWTSQGEIVKS